jgi:hypothetical protein
MIKAKTVFVLGAGAHCPYGLPDGAELIRKIVQMLPSDANDRNSAFRDCFFELYQNKIGSIGISLMDFKHRLTFAGQRSIDGFLAANAKEKGFPEIGKLAVARVLLPLEFSADFSFLRRTEPGRVDQDWMSFLFSHMLEGCVNKTIEYFLDANKLSFVTFNYDRTLEHFLHVRLVNSFGISPELALEKAKKFKIVHVYGSLGEFSTEALSHKAATIRARPPGPRDPFTPTEYREAANSIRLMYDDRISDQLIADAKEEILSAEVVCFLGFGFDPDNITRLELNTGCAGKHVGATKYGVAEGDWNRTITAMSPTQFVNANREWDSLAFLHETNMFR